MDRDERYRLEWPSEPEWSHAAKTTRWMHWYSLALRRRFVFARSMAEIDDGEPRSGTGAFLASIAISTNEHILEDSPLVKAQRAARMVNEMSMTSAEVGVSFGVSGQTIRNWTKLLELDHKVQKAVEAGQLKPTAAVQLHGLPAAEQREKLEALKESGDTVTVERARSAAKDPGGNGIKAPTKRIMRRVVEVSKVYGNDLSDDFLRGVRWAAGDLDSKSIKGLSAIMEEATKRPRKQAE